MNPTPNTSLPSHHNFTNANNPPKGYELTESENKTSIVAGKNCIVVTNTTTYKYEIPIVRNSTFANRITPMGRSTSMRNSSSEPQLPNRIQKAALNVLSL
jgi:hypothetical protein